MGNSSSTQTIAEEADEILYPTMLTTSVNFHHVNAGPQDPYTKLHQLLRANHATFAVLYNDRRFHNHVPHALGSAYMLGASAQQLVDLYEHITADLEEWKEDTPAEVTADDWRNFYGQREYQRGYRDYFDDEVVDASYDWKKIVNKYLLADETTLLNGLFGGLAHPLIHTAYAYELNSAEIATEALTLAATNYPPYTHLIELYLQNYDGLKSPQAVKYWEKDPLVLLKDIRDAPELDSISIEKCNNLDVAHIAEEFEEQIVGYFFRLDTSDLDAAIYRLFHTSSLLLTATHNTGNYQFDFVLVHTLTAAHATHVLGSRLADKHKVSIVAELWLFIILAYICAQRPAVHESRVRNYDAILEENRNWQFLSELALSGKMKFNEHYLKAIRALKTLYEMCPDPEQKDLYLLEGALFANEAKGFIFGTRAADSKCTLDSKLLTRADLATRRLVEETGRQDRKQLVVEHNVRIL
ncbi:uncharacterized protein V1518DRAFT_370190 [Limtongia smithiae]|uniref:uncharacterized protein n=1 Tax=Limtongia smithiae TaxID=1125753 RepID=UPI0034CDDF6E